MYTKESLARLGKQASDMYLKDDIPLSDAIVKIASSRPDMSKEHVQRVVENANLTTFEELFKSSSDKHVVFDLADPQEVHQNLSNEQDAKPHHVYTAEPSYNDGFNPFDHMAQEKASSYGYVPPHVQQRRDYYATKAAVDTLVKEASVHDRGIEVKMNKFTEMCKRASLNMGLKPVLELVGHASRDKEIFSKIASTITKSLQGDVPEGDFTGSAPNKSHPLYTSYEELEHNIKVAERLRNGVVNAEIRHRASTIEELM